MQSRYFTFFELGVVVVSLLAVGFLLVDPFMLERARALSPHARAFFGAITNIGRSNWILIPAAAVIAFAIVLRRNHLGVRNSAAYGLIISTVGYVFISVAGAGLVADLFKNILGPGPAQALRHGGSLRFPVLRLRSGSRVDPLGARHQYLRVCHGDRHSVAAGTVVAVHAGGVDCGQPRFDWRPLLYRRGARRRPGHRLSLFRARPVRGPEVAVRVCAGRRLPAPRAQDSGLAQLAGTGAKVAGRNGAREDRRLGRAIAWGLRARNLGLSFTKARKIPI